jgi:hypothetical protein
MQELLLTIKPAEAYNYSSRAERLRWIMAYRDRGRLIALVEEARSLGASELVAVVSPELRELIGIVRAHGSLRIAPVVPNMFAFIRDLTEFGMAGAGLKRVRSMRPRDLTLFGMWATTRVRGILQRDFTVGALLLLRMELAALRKIGLDGLYIHPQLTEIALATSHREFFERCLGEIETAFGVRPGLITNNPVRARALAAEWHLDIPRIVMPFNAKGYKMFPDPHRCEELLAHHRDTSVATEITADHTLAPEAAVDYLAAHGVRSAALDIREVPAFFKAFGPRALTQSAPARTSGP